ncbi:MAG: hypothetical protein ACJA1A_001393 [Saprospiraceae bacterium]|jgi:hypothetical protein
MKLYAASDFFENLITETDRKSEIKVYESFIKIISELENRDFEEDELHDIEDNLDVLGLDSDPSNRKKFYRNSLNELKKYLKDEHFLISEGYYKALGIALGLAFGVAFGSAIGVSNGLIFGMLIGLAIGASKDSEAEKQNRVLKTT